MSELVSFRVFLNGILTAAAFEIFGAVEKILVECMKENIPRNYIEQHELGLLQLPMSEEVPPKQQDRNPGLVQFSNGDSPLHKTQLTEYPALGQLKASKLQMFSWFLSNLLTTSAAEEISVSVEKMVVKYQEENDRLGRILRLTPEIRLPRIDSLPFSHSVSKEEGASEQQHRGQECGLSRRQENPEPTPIKEEPEDLRIGQGEEHDQDLKPDIREFLSPCVKRECDPVTRPKNPNQLRLFHTENKSFNRGDCGKSSSLQGPLTKHKQTHTGEKSHSSGDCGKGFCQKRTVTQYKLTHEGKKPFSCGYCGKSFSLKWTLTQHKMTHTGEKPFICADCGKHFRQRGTLTKHKLTHTGEKTFSCGDCGKSFMYRHHLKQHELTHTGEKPFCCGDCGKSFMYKHHLKKHKLTHTGEKQRNCFAVNGRNRLELI